jgi:hypothetical protein
MYHQVPHANGGDVTIGRSAGARIAIQYSCPTAMPTTDNLTPRNSALAGRDTLVQFFISFAVAGCPMTADRLLLRQLAVGDPLLEQRDILVQPRARRTA